MATQVVAGDTGAAPTTYLVSGLDNAAPVVVSAEWDGTGAGGDFHPCVSFYSDDGRLMSRSGVENVVTAGDSAEVTYAPFLKQSLRGFIHFGTNTDTAGIGLTINSAAGSLDVDMKTTTFATNGELFRVRTDGGVFRVETDNGLIDVDSGGADIDVDSNGGDIDITADAGTAAIRSQGAAFTATGGGDANVTTAGGNVQLDTTGASGGQIVGLTDDALIRLRSQGGDIELDATGGGNDADASMVGGSNGSALIDGGGSSVTADTFGVAVNASADFVVTHTGEVFLNLPAADPGVSGALWNDAGTVKVSP